MAGHGHEPDARFALGNRWKTDRGCEDAKFQKNLRNVIDYEIDYQKTAHNAGEDCGCEVALPAPKLN